MKSILFNKMDMKEKTYLKSGEKPPEGVQVKTGSRGGKYIDGDGESKANQQVDDKQQSTPDKSFGANKLRVGQIYIAGEVGKPQQQKELVKILNVKKDESGMFEVDIQYQNGSKDSWYLDKTDNIFEPSKRSMPEGTLQPKDIEIKKSGEVPPKYAKILNIPHRRLEDDEDDEEYENMDKELKLKINPYKDKYQYYRIEMGQDKSAIYLWNDSPPSESKFIQDNIKKYFAWTPTKKEIMDEYISLRKSDWGYKEPKFDVFENYIKTYGDDKDWKHVKQKAGK